MASSTLPQQVIPTKRATLYKMVEGIDLEDGLVESRRDSTSAFTVEPLTVDSLDALLVYGAVSAPSKWAADITLLTAKTISLHNTSPGAVLLIRDPDDQVWALTWGTGFHFLDSERIDFGFGTRVVARSALASEVRSITKTILDHRARIDRTSLPNGSTIRDLGVDGYGEVVSRVESKARIAGLSVGDKVIQLRAADSLNLPLGRSAGDLRHDLGVLSALLGRSVVSGLESIEQLVALKPQAARVPSLEAELLKALAGNGDAALSLSWPHERLDTYGPVAACRITGFGDRSSRTHPGIPEISDVLGWLADVPPTQLEKRINTIRLELHSEDPPSKTSAVSHAVSLRRWLMFEVHDGDRRYCLHDGSWYRMDDQYLERIDRRVEEILAEQASVQLPAWPDDEHEGPYNIRAAHLMGGYTIDKQLITTPLHARGGIEPCDIFLPPGVLIHVKRGRSSADLSHLLAQALVSSDSLARDESARAAWRARVAAESSGVVTDAGITEVILAIGRKTPIAVDNLFTFTKVNLVKQYDALRYIGVAVRVQTILEG
jgi:uncharacterized protein (TIGR04141 family)